MLVHDPNVFAGVRKGAFDTVSQHGGSFLKPDRNKSTAFCSEMTKQEFKGILKAREGENRGKSDLNELLFKLNIGLIEYSFGFKTSRQKRSIRHVDRWHGPPGGAIQAL